MRRSGRYSENWNTRLGGTEESIFRWIDSEQTLSSTLYKISANNRRLEPIESSPPLELTVHDGHELMSNNRNCPINGGEPLPEHQKRSLPFFHTKQSAQSGLFRPDAAPWPSGRPANRDQTNMGSRVQSLNQTTDAGSRSQCGRGFLRSEE